MNHDNTSQYQSAEENNLAGYHLANPQISQNKAQATRQNFFPHNSYNYLEDYRIRINRDKISRPQALRS